MKKLCILILAVVLFSSCEKIKESEKEHIELQTESYDWLVISKFNYSNHSYIMFTDKYSHYGCKSGIVHDPECSCYEKEDKR